MAALSTNKQVEPHNFHDRMASFPCMFNMPCFDHPIRSRLRGIKDQLLRMLDEGQDTAEEENKVRNTLTWIYYQLGLQDLATGMNESVLMDTGYECVVALGNFIFMEWLRSGQISDQYKLLDDMREKPTFSEKVLSAKAEQAFCLGKLGNMYNLMSAINLYEEILASIEKDAWRYSLGLAYRRLAVMHGVEKYSSNKLSHDICLQKAKHCFTKISESSDHRLKALGIANLAANYSNGVSEMLSRVESAVRTDSNTSEVYLVCGRPLIYDYPTRAVPLLENAVELRPQRSVSHHQLGKAYVRQMIVCRQNTREMQEKAQKHFRLAYETSAKMNIAPLLELARLLQKMGERDMAQREALTLLKSRFGGHDALIPTQNTHMFLFYLGASGNSRRHLLLSLLATIALVREESSEDELHAIWSHLFERDQKHAGVAKFKMSADILCKNYGKNQNALSRAPTSISKFVRDGRIDDVDAVASEARELLRACQNEEALLFMEFVSLRPLMEISQLRDLHLKLLLTQANNCLEEHLSMGSVFFRKAFDLSFSPVGRLQENNMEIESNVAIKIDMIMVFNDSVKNASTLCTSTAYGLEDAISTLFSLKVAFNPILDSAEDGAEMTAFVDKHLIDVIVVVFEGDGSETQYLLEKIRPFIANMQGHNDTEGKPIQIHTDKSILKHNMVKKALIVSRGLFVFYHTFFLVDLAHILT